MKARVKASGLIINAVPFNITYENGRCIRGYLDIKTDIQYAENEIDFINIEIQDEPDYWEKLKHQYAGMAMQGILSNPDIRLDFEENEEACVQAVARVSIKLATEHVNKLKEEEK